MLVLLAMLMAAPPADVRPDFQKLDLAAACLIRRDRVGAARLAAAEPGSAGEHDMLAQLGPALQRCGTGNLDGERLAGVVAQRLFNEFDITRSVAREIADDAAAANIALNRATGGPAGTAALGCLATLRPGPATALLRTKVGSPREQAAMQEVSGAMAMCVAQGEQVRWSPLDFRLGIARALYRQSALPGLIAEGA